MLTSLRLPVHDPLPVDAVMIVARELMPEVCSRGLPELPAEILSVWWTRDGDVALTLSGEHLPGQFVMATFRRDSLGAPRFHEWVELPT